VTRNVQTLAVAASSQEISASEALSREVERLRVLASRDRGVLAAILEHSPAWLGVYVHSTAEDGTTFRVELPRQS
jgi:hypothetical protein